MERGWTYMGGHTDSDLPSLSPIHYIKQTDYTLVC